MKDMSYCGREAVETLSRKNKELYDNIFRTFQFKEVISNIEPENQKEGERWIIELE